MSRPSGSQRKAKSGVSAVISLCLLLILLPAAALSSPETDSALDRVQKTYESIRDIRGTFVQKNTIKDLKRSDTYRGEFLIKRPSKMRWTHKGKSAQDLVISGDVILIYKKGDPQAYRTRFDRNSYGQAPVALLNGFGNIREEFTVTGTGKTLLLKPKQAMGNVTSVRILLSDEGFPIRSFTIMDGRSNVVEIELKDIRINTGLEDGLFDLPLPKGVTIYEYNP